MDLRNSAWAPAGAAGRVDRSRQVPPAAGHDRDDSTVCAGRSPRRLAGEAGHALITTMIVAACLLPLGAFAALQARLDALVQHHARAALETFTVAESGLEHALADFAADPRLERLLAGPDRQAGTSDDGAYPFGVAPPEVFPRAPFAYDVRVAAIAADVVEIAARARGPLEATRAVVATVRRAAIPFIPAALSLGADAVSLTLGDAFRVAGMLPTATDPGLPAVAMDGADAAAGLAARLPADAAPRLVGRGGTPSIAGLALPPADALAEAAARRSEARTLDGDAHGVLGEGIFVSPGALRLTDVSGSGVVVARGPIELSGTSTFDGLLVALGDVRVAVGSDARVSGAVVVGREGALVALRGSGEIAYDPRTIARIDAAFPGLLPRLARVTGWREEPDAGE